MKFFILLIIFISSLFAKGVLVDEKYFIDKNKSLDIKEIIKKDKVFSPIKKYSLGATKDVVWIKLDFYNNTKSIFKKRIYNRTAGIDLIDVYILKNNQIEKRYKLGDFRVHNIRDNHFRVPYFDLTLQVNEKAQVYIKQKTYSPMDIKWHIQSVEDFNSYYHEQSLIYFYCFGFFSVTTILSLILFFLLKNKSYVLYAFFTIFSIIYQFTISGFFYQFGIPIYLNTIFGFSGSALAMVFLGLFPLYFFKIKKDEFKMSKIIIKVLVALLGFIAFIQIFYPLYNDILFTTKFTGLFVFLIMLTLLIFSIRLLILKKEGSIFYFFSNGIFFIFISVFILVFFGYLKFESLFYYFFAIGTIGQDLFLGFALIHSTYRLRREHEKNTELLNEYSKLSLLGQTMVNISHQWKTPINSIYNSVNHIEIAQEFRDPTLNMIIKDNLKNIKQSTNYLKETALSQLNFYKDENNIEEIKIKDEISDVIKLIDSEFSKKFIDIRFKCDDNLKVKIEKNYFLNIIMILFENSFKIFEQRKIKKPLIYLLVEKTKNKTIILFEDNAGGVSDFIIKRIFQKDFSESSSTGIGLYLAKEIVSQKLNGQITAENKNEGLSFKIVI
ncbi:integral membrane sensor signal transduction histidine kinase [Arcobacter nitrofigilis DSM 7299]|uniref:histidine kinase n=1 Tax=Arcobacter nitrofigilis (strain ATCC 33309 / DSM 7299 / CCUG 15893 / LMG 7604 / NCTC 12251 / CI) TaxID=572480 RepID=D5V7Z0_ARCNC|nr:sensor histidine kinase [Arcobacter nitrofigilis]ADG94760.1 integral membrane sensor signal transduction histidine kinase [Arcobacter nitrofigilis DSM 7299]